MTVPQWAHVAGHVEGGRILTVIVDEFGAKPHVGGGRPFHQDQGLVVQGGCSADEMLFLLLHLSPMHRG